MTSYAVYEWKCSDCGFKGSVMPAFEQMPPKICPKCGASEILFPYEQQILTPDPIPEFEGSIEEQIEKLEQLLDVEDSPVRSLLICGKISALMKEVND